MNTKFITLLSGLVLTLAQQANANVIAEYHVDNFHGGEGKHGLWTGNSFKDNTFDINKGTFFTIFEDENGKITGKLEGSASSDSQVAKIDLTFTNLQEEYRYKLENGFNWNPSIDDIHDIDFFTDMSGQIMIGETNYEIQFCEPCAYGFQFGVGANAKNAFELGGSAWVANQFHVNKEHWDLNLSFAAVPEPGTLAVLSIGLAGLLVSRRTAK